MPRLNGKSYRGSKPITCSSRTLRRMPHCWPQKQQWVSTMRSTVRLVSRRGPVDHTGRGPKGSSAGGSRGTRSSPLCPGSARGNSAMEVLRVLAAQRPLTERGIDVSGCPGCAARGRAGAVAVAAPGGTLGTGEQGPPEGRTDALLVVGSATAGVDPVVEAQPAYDLDQILDVHQRGESLPAARAVLGLFAAADLLVETHGDLGWSLEDVEELAEGQPQEGEDHRQGVEDGQEVVGVTLHPGVARGQHQ